MKYIRTKDGRIIDTTIYEKVQETIVNGKSVETLYMNSCSSGTNWLIEQVVHPYEILKQADTIEELCDEFVVIGIFENQIGCCCDTFKEAKELKDYVELPQEQIIYGAIWTDKGLIYVAKMNEKGELELL